MSNLWQYDYKLHRFFLEAYSLMIIMYNFSTNQINQTTTAPPSSVNNQVTSGGVTIVKVGGAQPQTVAAPQGGYTRRAKLGDSRSTGRLHTAANTNTHRSMTRLNITGKNLLSS